MAEIFGTEGPDYLVGTPEPDVIRGLGDSDVIAGGDSNDLLFGDLGGDTLFGEGGPDIIRGGRGAGTAIGGDGDDTLYALGNIRTLAQIIQDDLSEATGGFIPLSPVDGPDKLTGGAGADLFVLQESSTGEGFGFYRGQQYAVITNFTAGEDKIRLPGSPANYITTSYNGNGTAIIYTEDPNIVLSISLGGISPLDLPSKTALVAIIPDVNIRNLTDSNIYIYGTATDV